MASYMDCVVHEVEVFGLRLKSPLGSKPLQSFPCAKKLAAAVMTHVECRFHRDGALCK